MSEKAYQIVEIAKKSGKLKKGTNEVTKAIEKGQAKLVVIAGDVSPKEITMHLPMMCKDKGIPCVEVPSREELGAAAGLGLGTVAVAITDAGDAKDLLKEF
jgi:large subunit ribosomal protein L7Ae